MASDTASQPWESLRQVIASGDAAQLMACLDHLGAAETARAISRLESSEQTELLTLLDPDDAADIVEEVPQANAADLIEDLEPRQAATIIDAMPSDRQADLLGELNALDAEAILKRMEPGHAEAVQELLAHPTDSAGGLMVTEYLAYRDDSRVGDVLGDLQSNRDRYGDYSVQYLYVTEASGDLKGVLRIRDLLFTPHSALLNDVMIRDPLFVPVDAALDDLREFFEAHALLAVPVIGPDSRLVGIVRRADVERAERQQADRQLLGVSGIIGGEEFRSMPLLVRSGRRLSWLSINIVLNVIAASVIALYQDTLQAVIALAVFLPMISDMSGCSGNQAVAVSMRELTLGLIRPTELRRVLLKEVALGVLNGLALGLLLGSVAMLWKGNPYFGLVVGAALALNTVVAVCLGGSLPLLLKAFKLDPALVSGPVLTTITDLCGFFFVLSLATMLLTKLAGT